MGTSIVSKKVLRSCRRRKWAKIVIKGLSNVFSGVFCVVVLFTVMVVADPPDTSLWKLLFETIGVWRLAAVCFGCFVAALLLDGFQHFEL